MKKTIIIGIILLLLFSLAFGLIYLNNVYLPIKVKDRLASFLSRFLNYNVEIEKLKYNLVKGVIIQNITVYDKVKDRENTILTIKEASFHILFLPIIKQGKVIIPIMHIDSPYLNIRYQKDNQFNFSRILLPKPKPRQKPKIKLSFFVYKVNIFNANGAFTDERLSPQFTRTVQDLDIGLGINLPAKISFLVQGKILNDKQVITKLSLQGDYNLLSKELNSKINLANLIIPEFNPYLTALPVAIAGGAIENSDLDLKFRDNLINLKGSIPLKGLDLRKDNQALTGDINIAPEISYTLDKKALDYQANLEILKGSLNGVPFIEKINNISGQMGVMNNRLWSNNLKLQTLNSDFTLKGTLENFADPRIKADLACEKLNLSNLPININNLKAKLELTDFTAPRLNLELTADNLDLKSDMKIKDKLIKINTVTGKYLASEFDIKGDVDTRESADPLLDLSAKLNLRPSDIFGLLPQALAENLKKMKPDGAFNIKGTLRGKAKDYKSWGLSFDAASDSFSIYNFKLSQVSFNLAQKNGILDIAPFTASVYGGTLSLRFNSNLAADTPDYLLRFNASDIDLAKLKLDTNPKDKEIAGTLNLRADLSGTFQDLSSLKGSGSILAKDGKLWQINLFKGLGELFLLPDFEKISFKEVAGDFVVADKTVSTENLKLTSEQLNLNCQGKAGFDGTLDFTVYTEANKNLIRDSTDIRKFTTAILGELTGALTIKLSGTIQKPKYIIVPAVLDVIKSLKDLFLGK